MGKKRKTSGRPQDEAEPLTETTTSAKKPTLFIRLPEAKASLKEILADLAAEHNRDLTGEVIQALEDYARRFRRWPAEPPPAEAT